jgi:cytochrome c oxidase subunit I
MLAALFFWFPKMFERHLDERLGKIHFWLTFGGVYFVFMPMHWLGLMAHSAILAADPTRAFATASFLRSMVTIAILFTTAAQAFFVANVARSLRRRAQTAISNLWGASTLEWSLSSPLPRDSFVVSQPTVYRGAYEFAKVDQIDENGLAAQDYTPQHVPPGPTTPAARGTAQDFSGESTPPSPQPAGAG